LTEHGLGVADGVRGKTFEHLPPTDGLDRADGIPDVHVDGFVPRNSGRPDLYPGIPHHFRGPQQPAIGRLDEVTAPEHAPAPEVPVGIQIPLTAQPLGPATAAVAATE
jgi:hypothetical protein